MVKKDSILFKKKIDEENRPASAFHKNDILEYFGGRRMWMAQAGEQRKRPRRSPFLARH
jgi:hypothetical protein